MYLQLFLSNEVTQGESSPRSPPTSAPSASSNEHTHVDGPEQHTRAFWVSQEALKPIVVRPRSHAYLGPILFRPRLRRRISATVYLKNNLTFVDSITPCRAPEAAPSSSSASRATAPRQPPSSSWSSTSPPCS
jgi:hypothetical protein